MGLRKPFGRKPQSSPDTNAGIAVSEQPSKTIQSPPPKTKPTAEKITTQRTQHEIFHTSEDNNIALDTRDMASSDNDDAAFCRSRCGCPDAIHDTLLYVGKKLYDCLGDPPNAETKDYVVGVSEIGEEGVMFDDATFCCWSLDNVVDQEGRNKQEREILL